MYSEESCRMEAAMPIEGGAFNSSAVSIGEHARV